MERQEMFSSLLCIYMIAPFEVAWVLRWQMCICGAEGKHIMLIFKIFYKNVPKNSGLQRAVHQRILTLANNFLYVCKFIATCVLNLQWIMRFPKEICDLPDMQRTERKFGKVSYFTSYKTSEWNNLLLKKNRLNPGLKR